MFLNLIIICNFFLINYAKGHAPPSSISSPYNTGLTSLESHMGMGRIANDEYEGAAILRERCTKSILDENTVFICKQNRQWLQDSTGSIDEFVYDTSEIKTKLYLREYAAKVLQDEYLQNFDSTKQPTAPELKCIPPPQEAPKICSMWVRENCVPRDKAPQAPQAMIPENPHKERRAKSHEVNNMVSAAIIDQIYGGHNLGLFGAVELDFRHDDYVTRLHRAVPQLFNPTNRSSELVKILEEKLGSNWKPYVHQRGSHESIVNSFESFYNSDSTFKDKIDAAVKKIEMDYTKHIRTELSSICTQDPEKIFKNHPGIFDQAMIDMGPVQRAMANIYLCKQKFYYDPNEFDSDCDGVYDDDDPNPDDPFVPKSSFRKKGYVSDDPPFASPYDFNVSRTEKEIVINLDLGFNTEEISDKDRRAFYQKLDECQVDLEQSLKTTYQGLSQKKPWLQGKELKLNFKFKEGDDLKVHNCFCSDCRVVDPDPESHDEGIISFGISSKIPRNKCWDDLTDEQKAATSKEEWRDRENAKNLTINSDCETIMHEIMHRMGLPDEYLDADRPYTKVGHINLMVGSSDKFLPRHIEVLLRPQVCSGRKERIEYVRD